MPCQRSHDTHLQFNGAQQSGQRCSVTMNILFPTDNDDADAVSDPEAGNKTELTNGQVETDSSAGASVPPSSDVRPSVPTSSGAGAMVSQAWGGARPKTTRTRPRNSEASTSSSSSSSARLRNSESVEIRVLPACDQNVSQQSSSEQEFPPSSLHSDRLIPRLDSLPHISSSSYLVTRSLTQGRTSAMSTHTSGVQPTSPPTFLLQVTKT